MNPSLGTRIKRAWNAFAYGERSYAYQPLGPSYSSRPDRPRHAIGFERSIVNAVLNRIAIDVSSIDVKHVRLDANDRYIEDMDSGLNSCLTVEANVDQTGRAFMQDVAMSMLDEGVVAIVPVDTIDDPTESGSYDIRTLRTGEIVEWFPEHVRVRAYNETTGFKEEIILPKDMVAIVENPLYAIVNEPNSTFQRLVRKLNLLDVIDDQSGSGKLDLIVQLPYPVKSSIQTQKAEKRRQDIEEQLVGSKYGIAYIDAAEKVTQLNRPVENNLLSQIEYLTNMLYSQLGITQSVLDGTADEKTMLNYYDRTIEPIMLAITDEMARKFLTKTARTQHQAIRFFRDPFRLVPASELAEIADKFTRNEIMSPNEFRSIVGRKPSTDAKSDELRNRNISGPSDPGASAPVDTESEEQNQNGNEVRF